MPAVPTVAVAKNGAITNDSSRFENRGSAEASLLSGGKDSTGKVLDKTGGTIRGVPFSILRFCPQEELGGRRPPTLGFLKIEGLISTPDLVE